MSDHAEHLPHTEHANHDPLYIGVWVMLLTAMIASIILVEISTATPVIITIFIIATLKALLVISQFMHLTREPIHLQVAFFGAVIAVGIFLGGIYSDVGTAWSVIPSTEYEHREFIAKVVAEHSGGGIDAPPDAGRGSKVYATYCAGCHQADGKGNNGTTAANLVDDKERMAQTDEALMKSIVGGKQGKIGVMPAWGSVITAQQQKDVLAYVRSLSAGK